MERDRRARLIHTLPGIEFGERGILLSNLIGALHERLRQSIDQLIRLIGVGDEESPSERAGTDSNPEPKESAGTSE